MPSTHPIDFSHPLVVSSAALTSADGEQVVLHDFGGQGQALLLGHGNGLNAGIWAGALARLRSHFHCYGVDLRGHGACRVRDPHYSVARDRFGQDLMACVDHINEPVAYAGHSLGGAAAVFGTLARPDLFTSMWLFEPVVIADWYERSGPPSILLEMTRRRRAVFDSVDDAFDRLVAKPPFDQCDPAAVRAYLDFGTRPVADGVALTCNPEDEARVFSTGEPIDFKRLGQITVPTLVAAGLDVADAHAVPAQMAPHIAESIPGARLEQFDGVGHFGPMEVPEAMADSVIGHLAP